MLIRRIERTACNRAIRPPSLKASYRREVSPPTAPVGPSQAERALTAKALAHQKRYREKLVRKFENSKKLQDDLTELYMRGFQIVEEPATPNVQFRRKTPTGVEVIVDFDCSTLAVLQDVVELFDVLIKKSADDAYIVMTCTSQPDIHILSVRNVPATGSFLDKKFYSGPKMQTLPQALNSSLTAYLASMGVDDRTGEMIEYYKAYKLMREQDRALSGALSFLQSACPQQTSPSVDDSGVTTDDVEQ